MVVRALLIGNAGDTDPGLVGHAMRRAGWSFTERIRESYGSWPGGVGIEGAAGIESAGNVDMIVSMGSSWSTYWPEVEGPVRAEQDLMRAAIDAGIPVFGICFGAQQLSTVLGGTVTRAATPEIGWCRIEPSTETARVAPQVLFAEPWMQWHYDTFTVPSGATLLATSDVGPQVFVHRGSVGLQFHPEATETIVAHWSRDEGADELIAVGTDAGTLLDETRTRMQSARSRCDELVRWVLSTAGFGG